MAESFSMLVREEACRSCGGKELADLLDFGRVPVADRLLAPDSPPERDLSLPLSLAFCPSCSLVQIRETVSPSLLYCEDYPYLSSVSPALLRHFHGSAAALCAELALGPDSLVVEAASNDGYMLSYFHERGIPVLGIDPSGEPVRQALAMGIPTLNTFFSRELAVRLRREHRPGAQLFLANNILAHVPDLNGFVAGIAHILAENGMAVIEVPYLARLIEGCEFDTIYHQHLCYFSVQALDLLFRRHGLYLNRVTETPIHGGSLRLFLGKEPVGDGSLARYLAREEEKGMGDYACYQGFGKRVENLRAALKKTILDLRLAGKRLAGYAAAGKAATLLAYCGIDRNLLDFVADKNSYKHGKFMGGNRLPILPPEAVYSEKPDYLLILAWNFAEEIMAEHQAYHQAGGRFIIPLPWPEIR